MKTKLTTTGLFLSALIFQTYSQNTIVLQPGGMQGKDAVVRSSSVNNNFGDQQSNTVYTWTDNSTLSLKRAFLEFDLSVLPTNANISSAKLSLYYNPLDFYESFNYHTGTNNLFIERVTSSWDENTITWNNQPLTTTANRVNVPPSTSGTQDYLDIDVTNLVSDMHDLGNFGFLIKMEDELNYYKGVIFASSDHPLEYLHPKLEITYSEDSTDCAVLKPNPNVGKDAVVRSAAINNNYGHLHSNTSYTWTNNGNLSIKRSFIEFDLSVIPTNATITSADLSLFYNPTDQYEGFEFHTGSNEIRIERVLSAWNENTITWDNQPLTTITNSVTLPPSISGTQDYINTDVTNLVSDMHDLGNFGFLIRMEDELNYFKSVIFASSDHSNPALHPELEICWTIDSTIFTSTSIAQNTNFNVYPNPNNGTFQLDLPHDFSDNYQIEIFDITGRIINNFLHYNKQITINTKGVFIVRLSNENGYYLTEKIIVK